MTTDTDRTSKLSPVPAQARTEAFPMTEDQRHERTEKAKAILRTQQAVLTHWVEGLTARQSAERLGISDATVEHLRRHLQLTRGQAHRGGVEPRGRSRECVLVVEVRR